MNVAAALKRLHGRGAAKDRRGNAGGVEVGGKDAAGDRNSPLLGHRGRLGSHETTKPPKGALSLWRSVRIV